MVVKRSGQSQPFDRAKIVAGVRAAAKNRPVDPKQMDALGRRGGGGACASRART